MADTFETLDNPDSLADAFRRSEVEPVVLFNHDPWCPISARAHRVMSSSPYPVLLIDVSRQREMTREIATRTGVRHESPQVIVIREREARWSSSHFAITLEALEVAMRNMATVEESN